jgi:hypothetical protein
MMKRRLLSLVGLVKINGRRELVAGTCCPSGSLSLACCVLDGMPINRNTDG